MQEHFLIVGAGLSGVSLAANLASAGARVTVVDRARLTPEGGTSSAWIHVDPTTSPAPQLANLIAASREMLRSPPRYYGPIFRSGGVLHIATSSKDMQRLGDILFAAERLDVGHKLLGKDQLLDRHPEIAPDTAYGAIELEADEAPEIITNVVYDGLMKRLIHRGGQVLRGVELLDGEYVGGAWRLRTSLAPIVADVVVNAAGAEAEEVAARCGVPSLNLVTSMHSMALGRLDPTAGFPPPKSVSPLICWTDKGGLMMRTEPYGQVWMCPGQDLSPTTDLDGLEIASVIEQAQVRTHYRLMPNVRTWTGSTVSRSGAAADKTNPLICWDRSARSFFWMAGFGRYGVQCAPAAGALASEILLGRRHERLLYDDFDIRPAAFAVDGV